MDRRSLNRRGGPDPAVAAALDLVLPPDARASDRRCKCRRRGDAASVTQLLDSMQDEAAVKAFALCGSSARRSAIYDCGCVVVDPIANTGQLQVLECPTHAALQAKLRRRQTDRH